MLEIKNLSISFLQYEKGLKVKKLNIVHDLNLSVGENEVVAIVGASGSGKSLLAHAILDLLPYNSVVDGEVYYREKLLDKKSIEDLRGEKMWLIPQTINSLNPLLKIKQQLRFVDAEKSKYKEILKQFGLEESVLEKYPFELSGGMARRILVSECMMSKADLIIADEPTPGMDDLGVEETVNFFNSLKEKGKSAVVITHDLKMALEFADKIAVFLDGTIISVEDRAAFENNGANLKNDYIKMLLKALPENEFKVEDMGGKF
ncbi:peptide/nickel transport system ATP-binding protein [Peptoniphilus asaccharolyticus DSM 20463]|uniref:Nickel import system ATP-binding protein NikD n=1 Tax=Peptoniphilus asaccharolyticus DSM 20463 TaxID=573058 RepID=A0A1W1V588_PEPAS|nr:ATP-binding cassette domain-containing protein [Peptoniphilus asaccharolyticus]MBL7576371.1 ABC transporter ATP-binding protein [Peptoniphilus asaccharolyticus]SMB88609.1 peptide/nickel transport system ATP-binding protein [Peptoniphilus asaccharolyticus DSM 20463]